MVRNSELKHDLIELNHRLDLIETVLIVSNPDSAMAADAYSGLRKTILHSFQATQALHATIAQFDSLAWATDDIDDIRVKAAELMSQYQVTKLDDYDARPDAFERIGEGPAYAVTKPAYIASPSMPPIQLGVAETVDAVVPSAKNLTPPADDDPSASRESTDAPDTHDDTIATGDAE